PPVFGF
ncbi:putative type I restriction enzymeP M protein, partial [Haemophilus influenzae]